MAILAVLLLVAVGGLSSAVLSSMRLARTSEESARADEAARVLAGEMQTVPFDDVFWMYNASTADDGGAAVPGAAFDVLGLTPREGDADGRVGRIVFPSVTVGAAEVLREGLEDARLGMPRSLNGDPDDDDDLTDDYALLPLRIVVEWTGAGGDRSYELDLLLRP